MKNILTVIKKEFARFFKDKRMVLTILLPGLVIFLIYTVMGSVMNDNGNSSEGYNFTAYVKGMPADKDLSGKLKLFLTVDDGIDESTALKKVKDGDLDLAIVFPDNFDEALENDVENAVNVKIYYNSSKENSSNGYIIISGILEDFRKPVFNINSGGNFNLADEKQISGQILAMLMPMLMFALLTSGCVAVAPEAIAGEKERGTMATMLVTPLKRWQLALGKIISLTCFAMLSGISSFLGVILSLPKLMGSQLDGITVANYGAGSYFMALGLIISVVIVIISAFSILSALAKSVKEAGAFISPLMIVIILLGMASIFLASSPALGLFAVPLLGSGLAMSAIFTFTITPAGFLLAFFSNLITAALLILVLSFIFKSEKIMFGK